MSDFGPTTSKLDAQRRELRLRLGHALGHSASSKDWNHNHLNIDAFMRELERFIDAKIEASITRKR